MPQEIKPTTKTLTVRGTSDDTFQWDYPGLIGEDDHDDCAAGSVRTILVEAVKLKTCEMGHQHPDPDKTIRMAITGVFGKGCCWSIGIAPVGDDEPMPDWPMRWRFEDYTAVLEVDIPADATVKLVYPEPGED